MERTRDISSEERPPELNRLLAALPAAVYEQLLPHLETVPLAHGQIIHKAHARIDYVYFPRRCVISLITELEDDLHVEAATVGSEGVIGVAVVHGAESAGVRALAQIPGEAVRMRADALRGALNHDGVVGRTFFRLLLRYVQALLEQTSQSVACNRPHCPG